MFGMWSAATLNQTVIYCGTESPYVLTFVEPSLEKGTVKEVQRLATTDNPLGLKNGSPGGVAVEWVEVHPSRGMLYAFTSFWTKAPGEVASFEIEAKTGLLKEQRASMCPTGGHQPCHACFSPNGRWLAVAHYLGGVVTIFSCEGGRALTPDCLVSRIELPGERPPELNGFKGPLAHGVAFDPSGMQLAACDAGSGRVCVYGFDSSSSRDPLGKPSEPAAMTDIKAATPGQTCWQGLLLKKLGARPRHLAFHPVLQKVYVLAECGNAVTWHSFDKKSGKIGHAEGQVASYAIAESVSCALRLATGCLPQGQAAAEIDVSADGRCVMVSNRGVLRGANSIRIFSVNLESGALSLLCDLDVGGGPRHFVLSDRSLIVGQQQGKTLIFYEREGEGYGSWKERCRAAASLPIDCVRCLGSG